MLELLNLLPLLMLTDLLIELSGVLELLESILFNLSLSNLLLHFDLILEVLCLNFLQLADSNELGLMSSQSVAHR